MPPLRLRYQTLEFGDTDIHVRSLRDNQQFMDDGGLAESLGISSALWPIFGVLWESGRVLAELMHGYDVAGRRILEVGCGLGLASLLLNHLDADITACDRHPEAQTFLDANTALNGDSEIAFERTSWRDEDDTLGMFDLVIGSDILYVRRDVDVLAGFIARHANATCEVVIIDPRRGNRGRFNTAMEGHGFVATRSVAEVGSDADAPYSGDVLRYCR